MRIARIKSILDRDYFLGGVKLERVHVEKDLGVLGSTNLSWNSHIDHVTFKAQRMLNLLNRTCRDLTDIKTKKLLYITWVRSRLEYASVVWSPYSKRNIRPIIGRDFSEHERLEKLNLLPLQYRREVNDLLFFFKGFMNPYILNIFN